MTVLINFKICDNSRDCNGLKVCPTGAFYWDEKKKTIAIDNAKCVSCGKCEESCQVGAIKVAKNDKEYQKIKKEIDEDPRKVSDLFIDRYGAEPVEPAFETPREKFDAHLNGPVKPVVFEMFNNESIQCLLYSIPIKSMFRDFDIVFRKVKVDDSLMSRYVIRQLPALLFFNNGKLFGKIEGYFEAGAEDELKKEIGKIMSRIKR
jgi:NAD-dependent dihydropyrimidine dehydrogenase PreA subunit